jgi:hypothetical protein
MEMSMSDGYDDWDWDDNEGAIEDYLEDRVEEYLDRMEAERFNSYYNENYSSKKSEQKDKYDTILATYVNSLEKLINHSSNRKSKPAEYTTISGSGPAWFYEPSSRKMIKTERGSEIVVIPGDVDDQGRVLVRTMNTFLLIPKEEVLYLGYN